jgi:Flp pilus assembly protein TadG
VSAVRRRAVPDDAGNAIVEFLYLAVLLMVPLVYVLLTVFRVQAGAYAVSGAAREAGRVYTSSPADGAAAEQAFVAAALVMSDSHLDLRPGQLHVDCSADPCLTPGATIDVVVTHEVALPLLPRFLAGRAPASVRVTGRHLEVVDRFRNAP